MSPSPPLLFSIYLCAGSYDRRQTLTGWFNSDFVTCSAGAINGVTRDGGYGEYVTLRTEAMMMVPADMDPALAAPLVCAGITVFNSLRNMDIHTGDVVGVQGIGGLGELTLLILRGRIRTDERV